MNVSMLIWNYRPGPEGGSQTQCRRLAGSLAGRGIDCTVVTQRPSWRTPLAETVAGVRVVRLGRLAPLASWAQPGRDWARRRRARQPAPAAPPVAPARPRQVGITTGLLWLARLSFLAAVRRYLAAHARAIDVLHVHESHWLAGLGAQEAARLGIAVVCKEATWPCLPALGPDVPFARRWAQWRLKAPYIALNPEAAAALRAAGIPSDRVHVIPNGVDVPDQVAPLTDSGAVLYVGNFAQGAAWKAFDVLIDAWQRVAARMPQARLTLVGRGDSRPWRDLAAARGCEGSVNFTGFLSDVSPCYRAASVFVLPSRIEGVSNALLEAQSWGLPAVVSDIPGNRAVVADGANGLVVPVDDPAALADAVLSLAVDAERRQRMGREARRRILQEFGMDTVTDRMLALYRELAPSARGVAP